MKNEKTGRRGRVRFQLLEFGSLMPTGINTLNVLVIDVSRQNSWVTELFEMYMGMNGKTQSPGNQPDVQTAVFRSESPPRMSRDKLQQGRSVPEPLFFVVFLVDPLRTQSLVSIRIV